MPGFAERLLPSIPSLLGYPWAHGDPRVDELQRNLQAYVAASAAKSLSRRDVFAALWRMAHEAAGRHTPVLAAELGSPIPHLSEPWYCCAEPTEQQLQSF